ncbi:MAG: CBU_0592 family membrane protein [Gammaproteobacteria bacterium]
MNNEILAFEWYDAVGISGVTIILIVYYLLQTERMRSDQLAYSVVNLLGAVLICVSLYYQFNLASFVIEIFWILISVIGIVRYYQKRARKTVQADVR